MLNRPERTIALLIAVTSLGACSWFKEKPPEYLAAREIPPIKVPQDLDEPVFYSPLLIRIEEMRMPSGDELNPGPPRVASTGGKSDANAYMAWSAEGVYLLVKDAPESVARRLRFAIERSGMVLLEAQENGSHRFEYYHPRIDDRGFFRKLLFWRDYGGPNYSGAYQSMLTADGENTRIYLKFGNGSPATTNAAEHILEIFMERFG